MRYQSTEPPQGRCTVCGAPLRGRARHWITQHPDGVHQTCRRWEAEPFPFESDLERMRDIARALQRVWRELVKDGRWLASIRHNWPARAKDRADEWMARRTRLQHRLSRLRDKIQL